MSDDFEELTHDVVDPDDFGARADVVVGRRMSGISRRVARSLGLQGRLYLDGKKITPSTRVKEGSRVSLRVQRTVAAQPARILECTDDFVYVLKPAGMHTQRLRPGDAATLADAVALDYPECRRASPDPRQGGAVHRLDRDTTGVVAFARSLDAWRRARDGFRARKVLKLYRAQVQPGPEAPTWPPRGRDLSDVGEEPPTGSWPALTGPGVMISAPLGAAGRRLVEVRDSGRLAITHAWSLPGSTPTRQNLVLRLVTGHRHQARVHLRWLDRPIVGDALYGGPKADSMRLHATTLDLGGACPGEPRVEVPVPEIWEEA
ncbi:MAG: pseudouridine synthase [Myxococcota bacterium]